jgi:hypothetical protein
LINIYFNLKIAIIITLHLKINTLYLYNYLPDCLAYIINIIGFSRLLYIYLVNKKLNVRIEKILNSV